MARRVPLPLRRAGLKAFSVLNPGDVTIANHWCPERVKLHSFRHKGYLFRGRKRETRSMVLYARLVRAGDVVYEVGGHIGYITQFLSHLVDPGGSVVVFEPGTNNLPYLRANVGGRPNVTVVPKGCGAVNETRTFFIEDLTGQNNSFLDDYSLLKRSESKAMRAHVEATEVEVVTLDAVVTDRGDAPAFLKIDVEGFEFEVLAGAQQVLTDHQPLIMVEVTERKQEVFDLLSAAGYSGFDEKLRRLGSAADVHINTFWCPTARCAEVIPDATS